MVSIENSMNCSQFSPYITKGEILPSCVGGQLPSSIIYSYCWAQVIKRA